MATTRSSGKRDLVRGRSADAYAKRDTKGRFKEMDNRGRAQSGDRRTRAKTRVKSGYGDKGDR